MTRSKKKAQEYIGVKKCQKCGFPIVERFGVDCDPQKRLVIFDGPYDEHGLPVDGLPVYEEESGVYCLGRAASLAERKKFKADKNPGKPYTVGLQAHWRVCKGKK
jgi:hypothetical protein